MNLAGLLLVVCAARHYAWPLFPELMRGSAWKALGAAATLLLLWLVAKAYRQPAVLAVILWFAFEEAQTLLCSVAYAYEPWPIEPGQSMCSARASFDLGAIGLVWMAVLAYNLSSITVTHHVGSAENDG